MFNAKSLIATLTFVASAGMASAQIPEVPAEVKSLDYMLGEWTGTVKWTMMGMNEDGPMYWKSEKDGLFMKQTTTMEMMGQKFTEVGYLGWDAQRKKYSFHTFTSWVASPRVEWGEMKDGKLIFTSEPWHVPTPAGGATTSRATMTRKGADLHFVLEFKNGDKWDKVGEGLFKKKT